MNRVENNNSYGGGGAVERFAGIEDIEEGVQAFSNNGPQFANRPSQNNPWGVPSSGAANN
jgi:hypothetical protein